MKHRELILASRRYRVKYRRQPLPAFPKQKAHAASPLYRSIELRLSYFPFALLFERVQKYEERVSDKMTIFLLRLSI